MSVLICKPLGEIDAVALPLLIKFKFNPVTPDAGILYNPTPSPMNDALTVPPLFTMILLPLSKTSELLSVKYKKEFTALVP